MMQPRFGTRWAPPRRHSLAVTVAAIIMVVAGIFSFFLVLPALLEPEGFSGAAVSWLLAFLPLAFTVLFVWFIDRWEPEPIWLYLVAFMWGGGVAVLLSSLMNDFVLGTIAPAILGDDSSPYEQLRLAAGYGAPIVEEFFKGLGVILIFFIFKKYFNGPVDGIVYGALIGSGFAFTENILYFVRYYAELSDTFAVRVLDGPFSHDAYTAFFGFFIGFAEYSRHRISILGWFVPAYIGSMFFHWFNNDALNWSGMTYGLYKFVNNVPVFVLVVAMILYSRSQEFNAVLGGLKPYQDSGWVTREEVQMLRSLSSRGSAKEWAERNVRALGGPPGLGSKSMRRFQLELLQLGHDRTRGVRRGILYNLAYLRDEAQSLNTITNLRRSFLYQ